MYLDYAATTPLKPEVKQYIIDLLDNFYNPSSLYEGGQISKSLIENARKNVASFINGKPENVTFTSSGSASNSLVIKGLTSENPRINEYKVYYSPTAHKSMIKASKSCLSNSALTVNAYGEIDIFYLNYLLKKYDVYKPLVCFEIANSEIGTINNVSDICKIVHEHDGIVVADATGYIPSCRVDMQKWSEVDFLTFSSHKLNALKGVGVLYKNSNVTPKPLVYGSQEREIFAGTENILGIASLGKAVEIYDYSSVSSENRDYVYNYIIDNIPDSYLVGAPLGDNRLPHNLYMCFKGVSGEAMMMILDANDIQVSTGSACTSSSLLPSETLTSIGMNRNDINSCIRMTFSGEETRQELDYVCRRLKECVEQLRLLIKEGN